VAGDPSSANAGTVMRSKRGVDSFLHTISNEFGLTLIRGGVLRIGSLLHGSWGCVLSYGIFALLKPLSLFPSWGLRVKQTFGCPRKIVRA
jgi:hypothetical protein